MDAFLVFFLNVYADVCHAPEAEGNCGQRHARWRFSQSNNKCLPFYDSGCDGNKNNFVSLDDCEIDCPANISK